MLRIVPYIFFLYIIAFLDRVNVGYAALEMTKALGFSAKVYGLGAGIFFIGYFLLEIPGTLIVEHWGARRWISRIMISWGLVAVLMGFMNTAKQFYLLRFLLGAAEAEFFPGIIVYLSHWFRYEDRAKTVALFMAAIPISNIIGAPVSGLILGVHWFGMEGWRWLFIIEAVPAIIFGVVTLFYLTDWPHKADWLAADEREWITTELEKEKQLKLQTRSFSILEAFKHREVILLTLAYFLSVTSSYGLAFWLPTIVKRISGSSNFQVSLISALPYCVALVSMLLIGWSSDRKRERRRHSALSMITASLAFLFAALLREHLVPTVALLCVAAGGVYGCLPSFWALPTQVFDGIGGGGVNWSDKLNWQSGRISWPVCRRLRKYSNRLIFRRRTISVTLGFAQRHRYSCAQTGTPNGGCGRSNVALRKLSRFVTGSGTGFLAVMQ